MEQYILDLSVGFKWFFSEEDKQKADFLLDKARQKEIQIIVPDFFYFEFGNACWKQVRRKQLTPGIALEFISALSRFPLTRYADNELYDVAFENALQHKVTVYDAIYLSLAEIYLAPLITADEKLLNSCCGRFDFIEHLRDVELN